MSVTLPPPLTASTDDDAVALLRRYYGSTYLDSGCYTGAYFDSWAPQNRVADADRFTADETKASKLMARKRPRLVPIYDTVVTRVLNTVKFHRDPIREALRVDGGALHTRLLTIRDAAGLPDEISALRVLDVVTWMYGKAA